MAQLGKREVDRLIKQARSEGNTVWATCPVLDGFQVRAAPSGAAYFYFRASREHGRKRYKLGKYGQALTVDQARGKAKSYATALDEGRDPTAERQARRVAPTVDTLADEYLERHAIPFKRPSSVRKDRQLLTLYVRPALGRIKVADVTREQIRTMLSNIGAKQGKPGQANKVLALASKLFSCAIEWGYRPDHPARGLSRSPKRGGAKFQRPDAHRYLSADEYRQLFRALDAIGTGKRLDVEGCAALRFIAHTGCRHREALRLRWSDLDPERGRIRFRETKTGDQWRSASPEAFAALDAVTRPEVGDAFVFTSRDGKSPRADLTTLWARVREKAKIEDARIHDLRHSFASMAASSGASLSQIGAALGHQSPQATAIYSHLTDQSVAAVTAGVGSAITAAVASKAKVRKIGGRRG